ncbi:MAG TPA: hypothetical protein VHS06_12450 [Chloroflexota bacterium]|nr:hypothetical protein [Chloroflexota bacterium]
MGNQSVAQEPFSPEYMEMLGGWTDALYAACDAANRANRPITVTGRLQTIVEGAPILRSLCRELAEGSGLKAELTMDGSRFTVRFCKAVSAAM